MNILELNIARRADPVDVIEHIADLHDWPCERSGGEEITIAIAGDWSDYQISFSWLPDLEALHVGCSFELKFPDARRRELDSLLARINEQIWMGHFDLWPNPGTVVFRQALLLAGGAEITAQQIEALTAGAAETCERYFQAFHYVSWAGKCAEDAMSAMLFETKGDA